jgi:hypothetical protein
MYRLLSIAFVILSTACSVNKQLNVLEKDSNEVFVGGKIQIILNGRDITKESTILFYRDHNEEPTSNSYEDSTGPFNYKPDSLFIITKLPKGEFYLGNIAYNDIGHTIDKSLTKFVLTDNDSINYIGDITINWVGSEARVHTYGMFGLVGGIAEGIANAVISSNDELLIYAQDNELGFKEYFNDRFSGTHNFKNITLNLPEPGEMMMIMIKSDPSDNPNYLTFTLTKDRSCKGTLRMIKKKDVYVEALGERGKKILYVFKKKNLISILDFEGNEVTEETMQQSEFRKINYNKYESIIL